MLALTRRPPEEGLLDLAPQREVRRAIPPPPQRLQRLDADQHIGVVHSADESAGHVLPPRHVVGVLIENARGAATGVVVGTGERSYNSVHAHAVVSKLAQRPRRRAAHHFRSVAERLNERIHRNLKRRRIGRIHRHPADGRGRRLADQRLGACKQRQNQSNMRRLPVVPFLVKPGERRHERQVANFFGREAGLQDRRRRGRRSKRRTVLRIILRKAHNRPLRFQVGLEE